MINSQILKALIFGIPIGITYADIFGYVAKVDGISMQPGLNPDDMKNDFVYLNRWSVRNFNVQRGDIVALKNPKDPNISLLKRVIALEGDIISPLNNPSKFISIPKGYCWIEGDHYGRSFDSNNLGPVPVGLIEAKATKIVWPPSRWKNLTSELPTGRQPKLINKNQIQFDDTLSEFLNCN